jgi:hypothetical protein
LIAQLVLVRVRQLVQELALVLVPQPVQVQELQLVREPVPQPVQVQELQLVRALVRHLPHQQLQSRFQLQRSRLLQHESLSTLQQLAKVLLYQLCL